MEDLIVALQNAWSIANETQKKHTEQLSAVQATWQAKLDQDRAELVEQYEAQIRDLKASYEDSLAAEREAFQDLESRTEEAANLLDDVDAERKGVLDTSTLPKRLLFEKLEERWGALSVEDIYFIEAVLDNKVVTL
jgi:septal ring factor EnvC (AmiA/AmiB activator)